MECAVLGPVRLGDRQHGLALGATKEAYLLAALAVEVGRPVTMNELVHRLWGDEPPGNPAASLYANAARLRRHIGQCARACGDRCPPRIRQRTGAYTLEADPDSVDLHRFRHLVSQAGSLADSADDARAARLLRQAEALWRSDPLAGLDNTWARGLRDRLAGERLAATTTRIGVELRLGRFADLVGELTALVERHPTDERLVHHLMVAQHGLGLSADALRVHERLRVRLRDELGTTPGPPLSRLHRDVLRGAPITAILPARRGLPRPPVPHNLPRHGELIGRRAELDAVLHRLQAHPGAGAVVVLQSISGMAGIGKSLLAWHTAERVEERYPDGTLCLDLHGHAVSHDPVPARAALAQLLRQLGVPANGLPEDEEELGALWRSMMARRRAVVVLDDAGDPAQVRPLLPGASPSLVLVTSRRRLTGLPGVRTLNLGLLPESDAVALFRRLVDDDRAGDDREAAEIVRLCGCLPLAVEIAACRLNSRPSWTLAHLIGRLSERSERVSEIRDTDRELGNVFYLSYATLSYAQQAVFRLLSLHPVPLFCTASAAAITGMPTARVEHAIDALLDSHLLQEPAPGRFRFHDLVSDFSFALVNAEHSAREQDDALVRLADFFVTAADAADRILRPARPRPDLPPGGSAARCPAPRWRDAREAREWMRAEHQAMLAVARYAVEHGHPRRAALLAGALAGHLESGGHAAEAEELHRHAVRYWRQAGDRPALAHALVELGVVRYQTSRFRSAAAVLRSALSVARGVRDAPAAAEALLHLGTVHWSLGAYDAALAAQDEVLGMEVTRTDPCLAGRAHNNKGITLLHKGRYRSALAHMGRALFLFQDIGDSTYQARVLNNMAEVHRRRGEKEEDRALLEKALDIHPPGRNRAEQAAIEVNFAGTLDMPEHLPRALRICRNSLDFFRELGDVRNQIACLDGIGTAYQESGLLAEAEAHHRRALELARSVDAAAEEGRALYRLGRIERRLGRRSPARGHLEAAAEFARGLGDPADEAAAVIELAALHSALRNTAVADRLRERAHALCDGMEEPGASRLRRMIDRAP